MRVRGAGPPSLGALDRRCMKSSPRAISSALSTSHTSEQCKCRRLHGRDRHSNRNAADRLVSSRSGSRRIGTQTSVPRRHSRAQRLHCPIASLSRLQSFVRSSELCGPGEMRLPPHSLAMSLKFFDCSRPRSRCREIQATAAASPE